MRKKGTILIENVVFIILNVIFISILILFLWKQGSGAVLLEQAYAKHIALVIDSAKPEMQIKLNMEKARNLAEENGVDFKDVVNIKDGVVRIKLSEKGGYEYSFFNDVKVTSYPEDQEKYPGVYNIIVNNKI